MSKTLRRNPNRNRAQPKRFENEKFVCGSVDRYQHSYTGWHKEGTTIAKLEDAENYYKTKYRYYRYRNDYPESLLEFSSIWRDMGKILPGAIVSYIGEYLNFKQIDNQQIEADDEFVVADEDEELVEIQESDEEVWNSEDETDDESDWSEDSEDSDYD